MTPPAPPAHTIGLFAVVVLLVAGLRVAGVQPVAPPQDPGPRPHATASSVPERPAPPGAATAQAERFLEQYVSTSGRVVRHDQGGDTVSEGQAWALLLAVALEDQDRAVAIVEWTEAHLARADGLLAWRWADGAVVDDHPASDADLVWAWGLDLAAETFGRPTWGARATATLDALAATSMVPTPAGPLLAAGPWATAWEDDAAVINPSYLWPTALRWAAEHESAFAGTAAATHALLERLVADDTPLVPDWTRVDDRGEPTAMGAPATPSDPPLHGLDAVRTWIWLAADCDPEVRALAAAASGRFASRPEDVVAVHDLEGTPRVDWQHTATLAGAAAVAHAAGDASTARARMDAAVALDREHPSYYGAAVTALAQLLLQPDRLVECGRTGG